MELLNFAAKIYKLQINAGRLFVHEHPANAKSWNEKNIKELMNLEGVDVNVADLCMYGLMTKGDAGQNELPAQKRTKFMTTSKESCAVLL